MRRIWDECCGGYCDGSGLEVMWGVVERYWIWCMVDTVCVGLSMIWDSLSAYKSVKISKILL
jgi:hypothetical protein